MPRVHRSERIKAWLPPLLILTCVGGLAFVAQNLVGARLQESARVFQRNGKLRLLAAEVANEVLVQDGATQQMLLDPELIAIVSEAKIAAYDRQQAKMKELEATATDARVRALSDRIRAIDETELKPIDEAMLERMGAGESAEGRALYARAYLPARSQYSQLVGELFTIADELARSAELQLEAETHNTVGLLLGVFAAVGLLVAGLYVVNRSRRAAIDASDRLTRLVEVTQRLLATNDLAALQRLLSSEFSAVITIDRAKTVTAFEPHATSISISPATGSMSVPLGAPTPEDQRFWQSLGQTVGLHITSLETRELIEKTAAQLRASERDLAQAHKLEAVGQLAAGIAHEINTPIQFVGDNISFLGDSTRDLMGLVTDLRKHAPSQPIFEQHPEVDLDFLVGELPISVEQAKDGIQRVAELVRGMKEFSHQDRGELSSTDLNRTLQKTLTVARAEYKYVADVQTEFGDIPEISCVASSLRQVFLNLICNAAHAIADRNKETGRARGTIKVSTKLVDGCVAVSIADSGAGMSAATKARLFEPFFTTKPVGKGTGQGLAISRTIVCEKHGGRMEFESELGVGTTFHIYLPLKPPAQQAAAA